MNHRKVAIRSCIGICIGLIVASASSPAATAADPKVDPAARTAAAVMAVDEHWSLAEERGDTAWLDSMLLPQYRSISADGSVHDKKALLAHAAANRGSDKVYKEARAWMKAHPTRQSVVMRGDMAILSFSDPRTGRIRSSDIFVYEGGGWHALYSQHSKGG